MSNDQNGSSNGSASSLPGVMVHVPLTRPASPAPARRRSDLASAILLHGQKQERRFLAALKLKQAKSAAEAAGVGPRESVFVRDAESAHAHAQREVELAANDLALAMKEQMHEVVLQVLDEAVMDTARSSAARRA